MNGAYQRIRTTASGDATIAMSDLNGAWEITRYDLVTGEKTRLEELPYEGWEDRRAARAMAQGYVESYAGAN